MDSALPRHHTYLSRPTWRNRLVSFLLAAATTALIALLMLMMGALGPSEKTNLPVNVVAIQIPPEQSGSKSAHPHTTTHHASAPPRPQPPVPQPQVQVVKPPVPVTPLLHLSHEDFAASDISKLPGHDSGSGSSAGSDSASTYGPGEGPGGVHLFNAEWYREPTSAEMSTFLPPDADAGTRVGVIACKTIEHYHVENCQELDESPPGSGMARGLRRAAWQFLIRPPRVNGHPLIGAWVKITYTLHVSSRGSSEDVESLPGADNGR